ncbi:Fc receptor-like protein 4 [Larus michahellis]|uniref:Fc receptor-like protein 4 n=1 Tax=Larus michahellis TaxID=119627 RepID=UPI003D9BC191
MAGTTALLLWAQAFGLAGAHLSQLTSDPPWTPVFSNERVTLTCRGSGAPNVTHWYLNGRLWVTGSDRIHVSRGHRGTHRCRGPGAEPSPPVTLIFSNDWLVLQAPVQELLEGDELRLRCRAWDDAKIRRVQFFHEQEALGGGTGGGELLLSPLLLHHRGRYRCQAEVRYHLGWHKEKSAPVTVAVQELFSVPELRLEGPAELPEGDPLALGCHSTPNPLRPPTHLQHLFYRDGVVVGGPQASPQLRLPAAELAHSGSYSCEVRTEKGSVWKRSAPLALVVRRVPVSGVTLTVQPPTGQVAEGDWLVLLCSVATGTGPLSFSWHRQGSPAPLATGPRYELRPAQQRDSGHYHCTATNGDSVANSSSLGVTVLVPVAGVTIAMARKEPRVAAGEPLNLSCSVRAGTEPVAFTWLRDGRELGWGPVLALGPVGPAHAGTYKCLATNRLGSQRVFQALSPALALAVTQPGWGQRQQGTAVAAGLGASLLLLLLLGAAVGWQLRRRAAARKSRGRDPTPPPEPQGRPPEPPAPPEAGEVLYAQVVVTGGPPPGSPRPAPPPMSPTRCCRDPTRGGGSRATPTRTSRDTGGGGGTGDTPSALLRVCPPPPPPRPG